MTLDVAAIIVVPPVVKSVVGAVVGRITALGGRIFGRAVDEAAAVAAGNIERGAANATRLGVVRNNPADWRRLRDLWDKTGNGAILSPANRARIAKGRTPVVDETWVKYFPEDRALMGERIPMHHIQGTPITTPLPETRHMDAHMPGGTRYNPGGPGGQVPIYADPPTR